MLSEDAECAKGFDLRAKGSICERRDAICASLSSESRLSVPVCLFSVSTCFFAFELLGRRKRGAKAFRSGAVPAFESSDGATKFLPFERLRSAETSLACS